MHKYILLNHVRIIQVYTLSIHKVYHVFIFLMVGEPVPRPKSYKSASEDGDLG